MTTIEIIDKTLLYDVLVQAKTSPPLRKNYIFHQSLDESCLSILNAFEPGTEVPIHHHPDKDEIFVILPGKIRVTTFNDDGTVYSSGSKQWTFLRDDEEGKLEIS